MSSGPTSLGAAGLRITKEGRYWGEQDQSISGCVRGFVLFSLEELLHLFLLKTLLWGGAEGVQAPGWRCPVLGLQSCSKFWNQVLQRETEMLKLSMSVDRTKQNYLAISSINRDCRWPPVTQGSLEGVWTWGISVKQILWGTRGAFLQGLESAFIISACTEWLLFYYLYPKILLQWCHMHINDLV